MCSLGIALFMLWRARLGPWLTVPAATRPSRAREFAPDHKPDDKALEAAGILSEISQKAGKASGFRLSYRLLVLPSATGGTLKAMSYNYHDTHLEAFMMACGIPYWDAKTNLCRRVAAKTGKQRGAADRDTADHGRWRVGVGGGLLPWFNPDRDHVLFCLPGRMLD